MATDSLMMAESSHSIYVNRLASQEVNKLNEFWGGYLRLLQNALGGYDSAMTQRQFNRLIKDVDGVITSNMEEWQHQLTLDLDEFAEYETDFQARMIGAVTDQDIAVPASSQVIAAAIANPIQTGAGAIQLEEWLTDVSTKQRQRIEGEIKIGYSNGVPNAEIVQRIVGTRANKFTDGIAEVDRRSAVTLVRTSTNHYANEARKQVYKENKRVVIGHRWVSTLDKRTSNICRDRDGDVYIYADEGAVFYPPAHANCLLGDTNVTTSATVANIYERTFKGTMIQITCESGRNITITPNHPILTNRGWVKAAEVDKFDKLIAMSESTLVKHEEYGISSKFEDMSSAFDVPVNSGFIASRPTTTKDFHGDGIANSYVNIVDVHGFRRNTLDTTTAKEVDNGGFMDRVGVNNAFNGFGSLNLLFSAALSSLNRAVSCRGKVSDLLWGASIHPSFLLLRSISKRAVNRLKVSNYWCGAAAKAKLANNALCANAGFVSSADSSLFGVGKFDSLGEGNFNACSSESSLDWFFSNAEELANLTAANLVDGVELDNVVDLTLREFDSVHVYNLENDVNWYTSNGIITHNCRSSTSPLVKGYNVDNPNGKRSSKGGKLVDGESKQDPKQVSATQTYYDWLKNQPAQFQDEVLGQTKGKIFRNSGVSVEKFKTLMIDRMNKPMTIDQMAAKDKQIADYLKKIK
ncbi:hypothetical protein NVP1113A_08 [Vibrio phage 1.113.A._10N.286.51.E7]|nr:hypothetical protein NVP1113A_08 [Vibrio phage 1.113.A._10N.286.51.E7]